MKTVVLAVLKSALGNASDNLHRGHRQFSKCNELELDQQYGFSGRTCREIYDEYKAEHLRMKQAIEWVEQQAN